MQWEENQTIGTEAERKERRRSRRKGEGGANVKDRERATTFQKYSSLVIQNLHRFKNIESTSQVIIFIVQFSSLLLIYSQELMSIKLVYFRVSDPQNIQKFQNKITENEMRDNRLICVNRVQKISRFCCLMEICSIVFRKFVSSLQEI